MKKLIIAAFLLFPMALKAQEKSLADTTALKSIEGILNESLRLMTGEKGKAMNQEAFRNLFLPTATFTVLNHDNSFPEPAETVTLDEFTELLQDQYYTEGYTEYEIGKVVNEYNGIAQVFQAVYQKDSDNVEARSVNSYQLVFFEDRWWIANIIWTTDSNGVKIPEKYLKKGVQD